MTEDEFWSKTDEGDFRVVVVQGTLMTDGTMSRYTFRGIVSKSVYSRSVTINRGTAGFPLKKSIIYSRVISVG